MKREQVGVMNQRRDGSTRGYGDPGVMLILVYFVIIMMMFLLGRAVTLWNGNGLSSTTHPAPLEETVGYPDGKGFPVKEVRIIPSDFEVPPTILRQDNRVVEKELC
ncbi:MAG: hypothetical protein OEM02_13740 [Desulfobulbaceae bacterium]|nr:hypothetical protein [Desulfobulbaceae bacterium]